MLAELDRAKTAFFNNISHEFRTPLTLILAPLEGLQGRLSASSRAEVGQELETVQRNALRLQKLVDTLLDFSRVEAGRVRARFVPVDLAAHTGELAAVFRAAIEAAGLAFTVRCEPLPERVHVDPEMWETIVLNLLSNAFKFTFDGEIQLRLAPTAEGVALTVKDTGIGVAPDQVPRLFERFHRIEGAKARTHEGSGIGLALVQELVRLHGGENPRRERGRKGDDVHRLAPPRLRALARGPARCRRPGGLAASSRGRVPRTGALVGSRRDARSAPPREDPAEAPSRARILVADDNADLREYLERLLSRRWVVETVPDGDAALAALRAARFDLVLTDVMMPGLDGHQLLEAVRSDPSLHEIPVIMLSARAGEEERLDGLHRGADDYSIKPFSAREVVARVDTHLKLSTRHHLAAEHRALSRLLESSRQLMRQNDVSTLLQAVVDAAVAITDSQMGIFRLYNPAWGRCGSSPIAASSRPWSSRCTTTPWCRSRRSAWGSASSSRTARRAR